MQLTKILSVFCMVLALLCPSLTQGQYYYNDLLGVRQIEQRQAAYKKSRINRIEGIAVLPNGETQNGFRETTSVTPAGDTTVLIRQQGDATMRFTWLFDKAGNLKQQQDESSGLISRTTYQRNASGQLTDIINEVSDSLNDFKQRESHRWSYAANGKPDRMWRIIEKEDGTIDSTEYQFVLDSTGLIAEEHSYRRGREIGFYYYYYNEQDMMTDIVRYNEKWKRLLPDQLFEYNTDGTLAQRMQLTGSRDIAYLIWRYGYSKDGLLTEEALFNAKKEHTGSIRFIYR